MDSTKQCLSDPDLAAISNNHSSADELEQYESHLETCAACRDRLVRISADERVRESIRKFLPDDAYDQTRFTLGGAAPHQPSDGAAELLRRLAPTDDPRMLGRLGSYEIAGVIGAGGMGVVLKALEPSLGRFVALKVLAPRFWNDAHARERFAREAQAAASIVHDNVIEIYGVTEFNGIPFFAMPYLRGDSLEKRIQRQGPLQVDEILRISMQVAAGLAAAHSQGLVHRDVKPANILLGDSAERVRITDFGIARLGSDPRITQTGFITGTPQYMSPEQVRGEPLDGRSDLFSLGSVMYAMCTGRPPFEAESNYDLLSKVVSAEAPRIEQINPAIPSWLAAIIARLHAPAPADRYQSAKELAEQLEQCLASIQQPETFSKPKTVKQLDARYRRHRGARKRRLLLGGMVMLAAAIITAVFFSFVFSPPVPASAQSIAVRGQVVDEKGEPLADVEVLAIQKTWPNNRFQQRALSTKTDADGKFRFDNFAARGAAHEYLVTVIRDGYAMTSVYREAQDGKQKPPITFKLQKAEAVTFIVKDASGQPVEGVSLSPAERESGASVPYLNYPLHAATVAKKTDADGAVSFTAWKPGESGRIFFHNRGKSGELTFKVPADRKVTLTLSAQ